MYDEYDCDSDIDDEDITENMMTLRNDDNGDQRQTIERDGFCSKSVIIWDSAYRT